MSDMNNKMDRLLDQITKVDEIQFDPGGIKRAVVSNSKDISNLLNK